jgi:hypothetical protein
VPIEVKEKIKYYRSLGQKKRNIKKNLIKEGFQPPTDNQIQHIINQCSTDHKKNCTLNDLKKWCEANMAIPEDDVKYSLANSN